MSGYLPISFIGDKIKDLENALFFSMNDSVLKIPTCVVRVLETDELGQAWFILPRPTQFIHAFDKVFPVKLDFFRKGRGYYLRIFGKAFLVNDPEEINAAECLDKTIRQKARDEEVLLVKVQISNAEYVERIPEKPSPKSFLHLVKSKIYQWFLSPEQEALPLSHQVPAKIRFPAASSFLN